MTDQEIYELFESKYPNFDVNDYRPLSNFLTGNRQGITVFFTNGDIIVYYPLPESHEERII